VIDHFLQPPQFGAMIKWVAPGDHGLRFGNALKP